MKEFVEEILKVCSQPENWSRALDRFNELFGITSSCTFTVHEFENVRTDFRLSSFLTENIGGETLDKLQAGYEFGEVPCYKAELLRRPAGRFYSERELFKVETHEELPASRAREISWGFGVTEHVAASINEKGPWLDGLFTQHRSKAEWQKFSQDTRKEALLPIFSHCIALGRELHALRSRFGAALSVLDSLGLAVFLVNQDGSVIERNKEAQRILDLADGLSVTAQGRLKLGTQQETAMLLEAIQASNTVLEGEYDRLPGTLTSERPSGCYDYVFSVSPLLDAQEELEAGFKCTFVSVIDPSRPRKLSVDGLTAVGQLTDAESKVVELLVSGLRPAEVAEQRDVSLNTVKTQLKVVSQKLRCSSQSDLVRLAAATRIPIQDS